MSPPIGGFVFQYGFNFITQGQAAYIDEQAFLLYHRNSYLWAHPNLYVTQDVSALKTSPYFIPVNPKSAEWLLEPLNYV